MTNEQPARPSMPKLRDMLHMSPEQRAEAELRFLEGLMAQAIKAEKFDQAARIFERVQAVLHREGRRR